MERRTQLIRIATLASVAATALSVGNTAASQAGPPPVIAPWLRAVELRSQALDERYHLGSFRPLGRGIVSPGQHPTWLRALQLRSEGLDRRFRIGTFTPLVVAP